MTDLRIVCTGSKQAEHRPTELAAFNWTPASFPEAEAVVWSATDPLREQRLDSPAESARPQRGGKSSRHVEHTPVASTTRADGGTTWHIPECPRCGHPGVDLRDSTLRRYVEGTRDTPMQGTLNVAHVGML